MAYLHVMKKTTLIIHANDRSTDFLLGLYKDLPDKTIITSGMTKNQLRENISHHDRIILCGHGSPTGLFGVGQFPDSFPYVIDDTMVNVLRQKTNTIYIWCNADQFVRRHGLTGFYTGMFLSEMSECLYFSVKCTELDINESNNVFAKIVANHIDDPPIICYKKVLVEYGRLAQTNPVARYNHSRLYLNRFTPDLFLDMVRKTA